MASLTPHHGPPLHLLYKALVVELTTCVVWAAVDLWRHRKDFI